LPKTADFQPLPDDPTGFARAQFERVRQADGKENAFDILHHDEEVMFDDMGIFAAPRGWRMPSRWWRELKQRFQQRHGDGYRKIFNMEMMNVWELGTCSTWPNSPPLRPSPEPRAGAAIHARIIRAG